MEEEEAEENDREISLEILIEEAIRDFFCSVSQTLFTRVPNVIGSYFIEEKHCNLQHNVISVPTHTNHDHYSFDLIN